MNISLIVFIIASAGIANMMPVFVKKLPILSTPLDGGRMLGDKRVLGDGKTVRGVVFGIIGAQICMFLLTGLFTFFTMKTTFSTGLYYAYLCGLLAGYIGMWALLGDLIKSFFKRRCGVERGQSWFPFDQIDWVSGSLVGVALLEPVLHWWSWDLLLVIPIGLILHLIVKYIGGSLKIDSTKL